MKQARDARRKGQSLVEFALVALLLYLLLAATVDLGRATFSVQVIEDAARVAARELALLPFAPGEATTAALDSDTFRLSVYDRNWLVVDLDQDSDGDGTPNGEQLDVLFGQLPLVNQQLRPLFVFEQVGGSRLLRFPGALLQRDLSDPLGADRQVGLLEPSAFMVRVPRVRYEVGGETIFDWVDVVEAVVGPGGADPFPVAAPGLGVAALRVTYPFQAAAIGNFREDPLDPDRFDPNIADVVAADDLAVADVSGEAVTLAAPADPDLDGTPRYGAYGLGVKAALGQRVRPFRRVQTAQAVFRRELFGPGP